MSGIFGSVTLSISKAFRGVVWGCIIVWLTMIGPVVLYLFFVIGNGLMETAIKHHAHPSYHCQSPSCGRANNVESRSWVGRELYRLSSCK
jgi:hypothetical protein